jgi:hypothetical protein
MIYHLKSLCLHPSHNECISLVKGWWKYPVFFRRFLQIDYTEIVPLNFSYGSLMNTTPAGQFILSLLYCCGITIVGYIQCVRLDLAIDIFQNENNVRKPIW